MCLIRKPEKTWYSVYISFIIKTKGNMKEILGTQLCVPVNSLPTALLVLKEQTRYIIHTKSYNVSVLTCLLDTLIFHDLLNYVDVI